MSKATPEVSSKVDISQAVQQRQQHSVAMEQQQEKYLVEMEEQRQQHSEAMEQQQRQYSEEMELQRQQHSEAMQQKQRQYTEEMDLQRQQHSDAMKQQQRQYSEEMEERRQQHSEAMEQQQRQYLEEIEQQRQQHSEEIEQQRQQHSEAMEQQKRHFSEEMDQQRQKHSEHNDSEIVEEIAKKEIIKYDRDALLKIERLQQSRKRLEILIPDLFKDNTDKKKPEISMKPEPSHVEILNDDGSLKNFKRERSWKYRNIVGDMNGLSIGEMYYKPLPNVPIAWPMMVPPPPVMECLPKIMDSKSEVTLHQAKKPRFLRFEELAKENSSSPNTNVSHRQSKYTSPEALIPPSFNPFQLNGPRLLQNVNFPILSEKQDSSKAEYNGEIAQSWNGDMSSMDVRATVKSFLEGFKERKKNEKLGETVFWIRSRFGGDNIYIFVEELSRQICCESDEFQQTETGAMVRFLLKYNFVQLDGLIQALVKGFVRDLPSICIHQPKAITNVGKYLSEVFFESPSSDWLLKLANPLLFSDMNTSLGMRFAQITGEFMGKRKDEKTLESL